MVLSDLIAALKARWWQQLAVFLAVLALVGIWTAMSPKLYVASASLLFDDQSSDPTEEARAGPPVDMQQLLNTQADIVRSDAVARAVVRSERLDQVAGTIAGTPPATSSDPEGWLVSRLVSKLDIGIERASNVIAIRFPSTDPVLAARIANAFATTYVDTQLRLRTDPAKAYTTWFEDRTGEVRRKLEQAQAALARYQQAHGFTDSGAMDAEGNRLSELSGQLAQAESAAADVRSRAGVGAASSSDVQQTQVIQNLRGAIAGQAAKVADLSTTYGPRHPTLISAQRELDALKQRLAEETRQAQASLTVSRVAAERRQSELEGLVANQRGRMIDMAGARNQMQVLQRDVDSARSAYDIITQRLSAMRLQAELPRTNVRQLDRADVPLVPASPNVKLRLFLGTIVGLMLAVTLATFLEWLRPRVRTSAGIREAQGATMVEKIDFSRSSVMPLLKEAA